MDVFVCVCGVGGGELSFPRALQTQLGEKHFFKGGSGMEGEGGGSSEEKLSSIRGEERRGGGGHSTTAPPLTRMYLVTAWLYTLR